MELNWCKTSVGADPTLVEGGLGAALLAVHPGIRSGWGESRYGAVFTLSRSSVASNAQKWKISTVL